MELLIGEGFNSDDRSTYLIGSELNSTFCLTSNKIDHRQRKKKTDYF